MTLLFRYGTLLFTSGIILGVFLKRPSVFCLCLLGAVVFMVGDFLNNAKHKLVCKICGHTIDYQTRKYCTECGGIMEVKKKRIIHQYKVCENGHRIKDENDQYKFCPECSKLLREKVIQRGE